MLRFTITLLAAAVVAQCIVLSGNWISTAPSIVLNVFLSGLTLLVYRIVSGIADNRRFTQVYLATIVIKIIAACSFGGVLIFLDRSNAKPGVILLLVLYFVYTAIEVSFLVRSRRPSSR